VVHGNQGQAVHIRERFRDRASDQQRTDEPGPLRDGDPVEIRQANIRVGQRFLDHRHDHLEMTARGELGDHTAVGRVDGILRGDDARQDTATVDEHRRGRLVTRAFDPEHHHPSFPLSSNDRRASHARVAQIVKAMRPSHGHPASHRP
jgi:hypothetical protein